MTFFHRFRALSLAHLPWILISALAHHGYPNLAVCSAIVGYIPLTLWSLGIFQPHPFSSYRLLKSMHWNHILSVRLRYVMVLLSMTALTLGILLTMTTPLKEMIVLLSAKPSAQTPSLSQWISQHAWWEWIAPLVLLQLSLIVLLSAWLSTAQRIVSVHWRQPDFTVRDFFHLPMGSMLWPGQNPLSTTPSDQPFLDWLNASLQPRHLALGTWGWVLGMSTWVVFSPTFLQHYHLTAIQPVLIVGLLVVGGLYWSFVSHRAYSSSDSLPASEASS